MADETSTLAESEEEYLQAPLEVPRPKRAQGQWELGYHEPLTPQEQNKRNQDGLDVYERIIHDYAINGWDSIDPADLGGRFRWYGIYTQRPEEDQMFMMRIRAPAGQLTADQLDVCAEIARRWGRGVIDVTDRQNFQFHNFHIEDIPQVWEMLSDVGISTLETCGDVTRNVLGCPTAGVDDAEYLDATPYVLAVGSRLTGSREFSNLPRKYKISITGCTHRCAADEINDIGAVAHRVDGKVGFDVQVGGGLSTTPHMARSLGVLVVPEELEEVCVAITTLFRDYGYRRARNRARLKFLVADWGVEKFREVLEKKYLKRHLPDGPEAPHSKASHRDHVGVHRQKDGLMYVGFPLLAGRTNAEQASVIADLSRRYGKGRVRLTTQQKMVILDIPEDRVEALVSELSGLGLQVRPSTFRRSTMACTGIEFCKLAVTETKGRAVSIVDEMEQRLPDFNDYARININGCPNACARFQVADIGFMGSIMTIDGEPTEVFNVHLGGHLGENRTFARLAKGARVRADRMADYIESMLRLYLSRRLPEQDFTTFLNSLDDAELQEFARQAMPAGALVEAGTSEGGSAFAVREVTDDDSPFARAAAARAGPPK